MNQPHRVPAFPRSPVSAGDRVIVALDVPDLARARELVRQLRPVVGWFKIGLELFTAAGPAAVAMVHDQGGRVFLDLKFYDIPNTVAHSVAAAVQLGIAMVNVHVAGGEAMLRAAAEADHSGADGQWATGWDRPILIGVTLMTSDTPQSASADRAVDAARLAQQCGLDGVVTSAQDAEAIRRTCGPKFVIVTPGIRLVAVPGDDQRRTATPGAAIRAGADFLVVGRPITGAADPLGAARHIIRDIEAA